MQALIHPTRHCLPTHKDWRAAIAVGFGLILSGCATAGAPKRADILWPAPPQTARIKFVGLLRHQDDLRELAGGPKSWLTETLLGAKNVPIVLRQPMGVAPSRDGSRLYVTDYMKPGVFVFDFAALQVRLLGEGVCEFSAPLGVAVDEQDQVYVVDSSQKAIRIFDAQGRLQRTITHERLERPTGIAVDSMRRRLYVVDSSTVQSDNHLIHVFDLDGAYLQALGTQGSENGQFMFPTYVALDNAGNLYVTDTLNARVQVFDPEGGYLKTIGSHGDAYGMFDKPKGIALDSFSNVYVADSAWSNVQIFNPKGQALLFFGGRGHVPGLLFNPTGLAIDARNRIYVADAFNSRVGVYQLVNTTADDSFLTVPAAAASQKAPARAAEAPSDAGSASP